MQTLHHLIWLTLLVTRSFAADVIDIESPRIGLAEVPLEIVVTGVTEGATVSMVFAGIDYTAMADNDGRAVFSDLSTATVGTATIAVVVGEQTASSELRVLPGWVSVMPAFLAIFVALLLRNVVPALLLGLWLGATTLIGFSAFGAGKGVLDVFAVFIVEAINDPGRVAIIVFTMMIGGMVGIITRNGGMASIVRIVVSRATTPFGGQVSVWLMGLMVFFDDYANTLVVGNTARPITDHLKISREKLAYIVDSTAAPVVCLALVTTWIGYQVSLIDQAMQGIDGLAGTTAYSLFLNSIPYSFYPILAIVFVLAVAVTGRDFGPMYKAEMRARQGTVESERETELPAVDGDTLPLELVPAVVFVLAAVTAFSTGTSWGTMGILLPLVLPLAWAVMTVSGVADASGMHIMNSSIACVLAGAVWGDHCSPISDTTVLSSIASGCDHIEHVRTQMPYALLVGAVAVAVGTVPAGYGMSPWISIIAGAAILVGVLRYLGRKA